MNIYTRDRQRCEAPDCDGDDALAVYVYRGVMLCEGCSLHRRAELARAGHVCCSCGLCLSETLTA